MATRTLRWMLYELLSFVVAVLLLVAVVTTFYRIGQTPQLVVSSTPVANVSPFGVYRQYYCQPGCRVQFHRVWELHH